MLRLFLFLIVVTTIFSSCGKKKPTTPENILGVPIVSVAPNYPTSPTTKIAEGYVTIEFIITTNGTVRDPKVTDSVPPRLFDKEAIRALLKYKFVPKQVKGVYVEYPAKRTITFKLAKE